MIKPLKLSGTSKGPGLARVVLASFALLACENLLAYGPEPTLSSSGGKAGQGGGAGEADGTGGTASGSRSASEAPNGTYGGGSTDKGLTESFVAGGGTSEVSGTGGVTVGSGGTSEVSGTGGVTVGSGGTSEVSGTGGVTVGSGGTSEVSGTGGVTVGSGGTTATSSTSTKAPPGYTCSVDVANAKHDCVLPIKVMELAAQMGVLSVDMVGHQLLTVEVDVVDPGGYVLDIGDSYCTDGGGGDCTAVSNDAELEVTQDSQGGFPLTLWASDLIVTNPNTTVLATIPNFFSATGTTVRTLYLSDGKVRLDGTAQWWESPALLRLGAPDTEGPPDNKWYIGLNRVVWEALRTPPRIGSGIRKVTLRLQ